MPNTTALRLPVVALGAEHLAIGYLMRRNILAYKAPPNNQAYDLICVHPDPAVSERIVRVQVKSRYQTDCDRSFPVKAKSFEGFDYLMVVFLNIGFFFSKTGKPNGIQPPEILTIPNRVIRANHYQPASGFEKVLTKKLELDDFAGDQGIEQIAKDLGVPYPSRP